MKVLVIGTGYVGLIQGVGLAELGHNVVCIDNNHEKVTLLKTGKSPIYEPGLDGMLERNIKAKRITFDTAIAPHVNSSEIIFIAVGTPSDQSGRADLRAVMAVTEEIAKAIKSPRIIVIKSTVPIGTNNQIKRVIASSYSGKFDIVSNPEFLREGTAIEDFMRPDRIVIGVDDKSKAGVALQELYQPLDAPVVVTNLVTAEMIKYASNSYLATQISYINSIARICEEVGADVKDVAEGMKLDKRIGSRAFLSAGLGYGGSCFPKDVKALIAIAHDAGVDFSILEHVEDVNKSQRMFFMKKVKDALGSLENKTIAVWGIAFKPGTDDVREAPAIEIITRLIDEGAHIRAYDPVALESVQSQFPHLKSCSSFEEAAHGADALLIMTEWSEIKAIDLKSLKKTMRKAHVFDGRNMFEPRDMKKLGFQYFSIGR